MIKKIIVLSLIFTLVACGSDGAATPVNNSNTAKDIFHGIAVPPEPDAMINNSTLLGIDVNNNGVRDDVERLIAIKYGANSNEHAAAIMSAQSDQEYLTANGDPVKSTATTSHSVIVGACMFEKFNKDGIAASKAAHYIFPLSFNTTERMTAYRSTSVASTEVSTTIPQNPCQ
jgi:hypothetical protein